MWGVYNNSQLNTAFITKVTYTIALYHVSWMFPDLHITLYASTFVSRVIWEHPLARESDHVTVIIMWTATWEKVPPNMCAQRRLRSACTSAQSHQSSLSAWRNFTSLTIHIAPRKVSDQAARMRRLIRLFPGRTVEGTFSDVACSSYLFLFFILITYGSVEEWESICTRMIVLSGTLLLQSRLAFYFCIGLGISVEPVTVRYRFSRMLAEILVMSSEKDFPVHPVHPA